MKLNSSLTPERYLSNKVYFDNGLISCLESQTRKLNEANKKILLQEATIYRQRKIIKKLRFRYKDASIKYSSSKHKN